MNETVRQSADNTSSSLLARVNQRDANAWLQLVQWIGPFILRWCRQARLQPADCDNVGQEVLQRVWSRLSTFRKETPGQSFRGWVYTVTKNCIADLRRQGVQRPLTEMAMPAEPDPSEAGDFQSRAVRMVLQQVFARHAEDPGFRAFYRTAVDGLSAPEVARELGMKAWTVRQHRCRWIKRLREQLRVEFGDLLT
jgi:RNA polymerase sigma-70 factor (ECF subfamily)